MPVVVLSKFRPSLISFVDVVCLVIELTALLPVATALRALPVVAFKTKAFPVVDVTAKGLVPLLAVEIVHVFAPVLVV